MTAAYGRPVWRNGMGETRRLEGLGQLGFDFPMTKSSGVPARSQGNEAEVFLAADPCELFVGAQRLDAYLREVRLGWVLRLAALLRELDLSALIGRYQPTGQGLSSEHAAWAYR